MAGRIVCCTETQYIPIKLHYFFFNAGLAGILSYLSVYGKQLGISPVFIGIIFTVLPLVTMIAKPLVGSIADRTKKLKIILCILLLLIIVASILLIFIPSKNNSVESFIVFSTTGTTFQYENQPIKECMSKIPEHKLFLCYLSCTKCMLSNYSDFVNKSSKIQTHCNSTKTINGEMELYYTKHSNSSFNVTKLLFNKYDMSVPCLKEEYFSCSTTCDPHLQNCYHTSSSVDYESVQFWAFFILAFLSYVPGSICVSLGDAACFNLLGENAHLYGNQRLWGTVGWGIFGLVTGALNTYATGASFIHAYYPGFSLVVIFLLLDAFSIRKVSMDNLILSKSIFKDVIQLLKKINILMFLCSVFVTGVLTGFLWTFLFWHLVNLNASTVLLGAVTAVQCMAGELPFMYFSGFILSKIGHFNTLSLNFLAFGIRFTLYSYLKNPVWVLFIEILQGPSLGLFYSTMPTYANIAALPGTEATMQGLAGGAFEGLGLAVGNIIGGIGMQKYKGSILFFYGGILSLIYCVVNIMFTVILRIVNSKRNSTIQTNTVISPNEGTAFL